MQSWRWIVPAAVPVVAALGLAGCGSGTSTTTPTTASAAPASVPSTTAMASPSTTTAPSGGSSTTSAAPSTTSGSTGGSSGGSAAAACRTGQLSASLGRGNGAAGSVYYPLQLVNTGSAPCTLRGYPGVSFVAGNAGTQVGAAAQRTHGQVTTVTLQPHGAPATATLRIVDARNFPSSCQQTAVRGLRIYPPNQTAALYVPHPGEACANSADVTLYIAPVSGS